MVLKNKKAFMIKWVIKIVLLLLILTLASLVGCRFIKNITGASPKDQSIAQFNTFVAQIESLSYVNSNYTSSYIQLGLNKEYYVIGFSDKRNSEINEEHDVIKRPSKCESHGSCFCLYQKKPNPKKANANILTCRTLENIDYVVADKLFVEVLKKTADENDNFLQDGVNFIGATIMNNDSQYNNFNYLYYYISSFIINNVYPGVYSQTYRLGFNDNSDYQDLYYLALTSSKLQIVQFYVELINYEDSSSLLFFPYNRGLFNRKYFLNRQSGVDFCDQNFVNTVIKEDDGTLKYCIKESKGLVKSDDTIELCPAIGEVQEMCACGPSVINNGYCLIDNSKDYRKVTPIISILPLDFCVPRLTDCADYYDEFACEYDVCTTIRICNWDKTEEKCVSGCPTANWGCGFYDSLRCDSDLCNFEPQNGCIWDEGLGLCVVVRSSSSGSNYMSPEELEEQQMQQDEGEFDLGDGPELILPEVQI